MPQPVSAERYSLVARTLHWAIAALILANLVGGLLVANFDGAPWRRAVFDLHKANGFVILVLCVLRLAWRLYCPPPAAHPGKAAWGRPVAALTHTALYFLMVLTPLVGLWVSSAAPTHHAIMIFGWQAPFLPVLQGREFAGAAGGVHRVLAWTMMAMLVLHVGAALRHRFIDRDGVMDRMSLLPRKA